MAKDIPVFSTININGKKYAMTDSTQEQRTAWGVEDVLDAETEAKALRKISEIFSMAIQR